MITKKIQYGQTLTDIALQEYGCVEGIFILMEDNPMLNMDGILMNGYDIQIRESVPNITDKNRITATELKERAVRISTGTGETQDNTYVDDTYVLKDYTI